MNETSPTLADQIVYGLEPDDLSGGNQENNGSENDDNLIFLTNHYIPGGSRDMIEQRRQELREHLTTHTEVVHGDAIDPKTDEPLRMENVVGFYAISQ